MRVGLIGLPNVGKKTLFGILTGEPVVVLGGQEEVKFGAAKIRDARFDRLVEMYRPAKSVPATLDLVLLPKFDKETIQSGECLKAVEKCDALVHIVRVFEDDTVFHVEGSVNPLRDIENVFTELILSDLILVEKRLERIEKEAKVKGDPKILRERDILVQMKTLLDQNQPLMKFELSQDDRKLMSTYQFLTRRPLIIVLNVNDDKIADSSLLKTVEEKYRGDGTRVMQISAKIESEISSLSPEEREVFLQDLKIAEPALNILSRLCFEALGLMSFFTVGEDEVRQWTTRRCSTAPQAAGAIHSDLERGFIRAEIMKTEELFAAGDEAKLKEAGRLYLKGKDYVVEDGDIMHVRFNV